MATTDLIVLIISVFSLMRGASRGFVRSLTGPFSMIVSTAISMFYFQITQDMIASLIIAMAAPILIGILVNFLLNAWIKSTDRAVRPGFISRSAGALMTAIWSWVFIIFTLVLLGILPPWGDRLTAIHNDVTRSASYCIAKPIGNAFFGLPVQKTSSATDNTTTNTSGANTSENATFDAKTLAQDPRFQKILQDPEIQDEIKNHDITQLMNNPQMVKFIQQIMRDPETMKRIMTLYSNQTQPHAQQNTNQ